MPLNPGINPGIPGIGNFNPEIAGLQNDPEPGLETVLHTYDQIILFCVNCVQQDPAASGRGREGEEFMIIPPHKNPEFATMHSECFQFQGI